MASELGSDDKRLRSWLSHFGTHPNTNPTFVRLSLDTRVTHPCTTAPEMSFVWVQVIEAIVIARCVFQRVKNFINYRIAATLQVRDHLSRVLNGHHRGACVRIPTHDGTGQDVGASAS